jgi:hypothetical protein
MRLRSPGIPQPGSRLPEALGFTKEHLRRFQLSHLDVFSLCVQIDHHLIGKSFCLCSPSFIGVCQFPQRSHRLPPAVYA